MSKEQGRDQHGASRCSDPAERDGARTEAPWDRPGNRSRDEWGPCCLRCPWAGQPMKPCAVCDGKGGMA